MNPPAAFSKDVSRAHDQIRGPELGSALKRERLLQRVLAARKRFPHSPGNTLARAR